MKNQEIIKKFPRQPEYLVSNKGYVLSKKNPNKKLKPSINHSGYEIVQLMNNNKKPYGISVHTIIAITFLGTPKTTNMQVNHIDGNKQNNDVTNLEWVTPSENSQHAVQILRRNIGKNNNSAKKVIATNINNNNIKIYFPSLYDAAKACQNLNNHKKISTTKNIIWKAVHHYENRHSAYGYYWNYL